MQGNKPVVDISVSLTRKLDDFYISNDERLEIIKEGSVELLETIIRELVEEDVLGFVEEAQMKIKIKVKCKHKWTKTDDNTMKCEICGITTM